MPTLGPTIDALIAERARTHPDAVFLRFPTGDLTFAEVAGRVERLAGAMSMRGIGRGDVVAVVMPNVVEHALALFATVRIGAVACLVNTGFRGRALDHALHVSGAKLVVSHPDTHDQVLSVKPAATIVTLDEWRRMEDSEERADPSFHRASDPGLILFTSGTTGPSKGCVLPHRYFVRQAELMVANLGFSKADVLYSPFPLFHIDATVLTIGPALVLGTTAAIGERFSVSGFWDEARRFGATVFDFMGATLTLLHKAEPSPIDSAHRLRLGWGVPVPEFADEFERRFGCRLVELYGSTDAGLPIYHPVEAERRPGSCGKAIDAYDVAVVDEAGFAVDHGVVGELVVRPLEPSIMSAGYIGMDVATLESRRDLWFHTGDLVKRDSDGWFYFMSRGSDTIRRRGENISAFEVEEVVKLHPAVVDAAAFGVPSELTEDDVMVAVVVGPGYDFTPRSLIEFCRERMGRHSVPRYIDVVDRLPRTPTEKVQKQLLRSRGVTPTTWDGNSR